MKHLKRSMLVCMLTAMFIPLLLTAGVAGAASRIGGSWRSVSNSNANVGTQSNNLNNRVLHK